MESDVKQRLIAFIRYLGLSKNAFEHTCGLSTRYVSNISSSVSPEKLKKISLKFPELNTAWLLTGEGEMLKPSASVVQHNSHGNNNYVVGTGNRVQCSNCGGEVSVIVPDEVQGAPIIPTALSRQPNIDILEYLNGRTVGVERSTVQAQGIAIDVWHRVRDNSLAPDYCMGDMLGLWSYPLGKEKPIPGKLYAVDTYSNGLVVRKLFPLDGAGYRACAINTQEFPDFDIDREDVIRIYRVMIMVRI